MLKYAVRVHVHMYHLATLKITGQARSHGPALVPPLVHVYVHSHVSSTG